MHAVYNKQVEERIWGKYLVCFDSDNTSFENVKVKILFFKEKSFTSIQKHNDRSEIWIPLTDRFVNMATGKHLVKNDIYVISPGEIHQLYNSDWRPGIVLEIQFGVECNEEDIIRYVEAKEETK